MDWHSAKLSPETVITNNFRLTQNVRRFYAAQLGRREVQFNREQMRELKNSVGKTLGEMCRELFGGSGEYQ